LSATARLLLKLLSEPPDLAPLSDPVSWNLIRENAGPSGVAPLVAFIARPHLPLAEQRWCDKVLTQSWASYEKSLYHLNNALGILEDEGIRALALKGPVLARRCYDPPFLRKPSIDLDLAMDKRDLDRACEAFMREGFVMDEPVRRAKMLSHHAVLTHASRPRIELHFRLSHRSAGIPVEEFFGRAQPHALPGGRVAWVLARADEALHLILHTVSDRFATLFHLYEARRIWLTMPLDVRQEALRRGIDYHFAGALKMADVAFRSLWGDGLLPPDFPLPGTWLHWQLNEKLLRSFEDWWGPDPPLRLMDGLWGRWLDFQMTDRPVDAAKFAANIALTAWFQAARRAPVSPSGLHIL
jgi:hypothetical protein